MAFKAKIKQMINKILIVVYSYLHLPSKKKTVSADLKEILVIEVGVIGDSIIFLGALRELSKRYNSASGYQMTLVCRKDMYAFWGDNLSNQVQIMPVEVIDTWPSLSDFMKAVALLEKKLFEKCIVLMSYNWGDYLALCVNADKKAALNILKKSKKFITRSIFKYVYDISVDCTEGLFLPNATERLMHLIGCREYKAYKESIRIPESDGPVFRREYVIVAPMANRSFRNLSKEQTVAIINYILQKTSMIVLLTGRTGDVEYIEEIVSECGNDRVVNYAGKTDFNMFLHMISGAKFIVTADSGQVHVAAALSIPSVCLTGYWEMGFLPYNFTTKSDSDPICVYSQEKDCKYCKFKPGGIGKDNRECKKRVHAGKNALCLEEIDMNNVYKAIDLLLDDSGKGVYEDNNNVDRYEKK